MITMDQETIPSGQVELTVETNFNYRVPFTAIFVDSSTWNLRGIHVGIEWKWVFNGFDRYYCRDTVTALPIPDSDLLTALSDWYWEGRVLCDKELVDSLIEDASLTAWFPRQDLTTLFATKRILQPVVAFIATKSGLTRWIEGPRSNASVPSKRRFSALHPRGPEEVWYRRASLHPELIVVSSGPVLPTFTDDVNLESEWQDIHPDDMIITVSKAVVVEGHKSHQNIPAVVGMQFTQNTFQSAFYNLTNKEWCVKKTCGPPCGSPKLECFLLDADSIIIASSKRNASGFPFGKLYPYIMQRLIDDGIFRIVSIKDHQAVCLRPVSSSTPIFSQMGAWMSTSIILSAMSLAPRFPLAGSAPTRMLSVAAAATFSSLVLATSTSNPTESSDEYGYEQPGKIDLKKFLAKIRIPKSQPQSCTRQIDALQLRLALETGPRPGHSGARRHVSCADRPYSVAYVPGTNLLFVSVLTNCSKQATEDYFDLSRYEIQYNASCLMTADIDLTKHRNRKHHCRSHHNDEELNTTDCGLDHMVPVDEAPPEPPMFIFDYDFQCARKLKKKDKVAVEF